MILIVCSHGDGDITCVTDRLRSMGHAYFVFDPEDYPARSTMSVSFDGRGIAGCLRKGAHDEVDFEDIHAAWYRHPGKVRASDTVRDARTRAVIEDESRLLLQGVWAALPCRWMPAPPDRIPAAEFKVRELLVAQAVGFELPHTLLTNDERAFLSFAGGGKRVISKAFGTSVVREVPGLARYTERVSHRNLLHYQSVRLAPAIFQEQIAKRVEIRATVVGEQVFAVEIHSQATARTRQDWRRYNIGHTPHLRHSLPAAVAAQCVQVVARLGLCFGAIDLILTPEGRYVFLEVNAGGQWQWMEELTGLPIYDAVARLLCDWDHPIAHAAHAALEPLEA